MQKSFLSYKASQKLHELGFNEPCQHYYRDLPMKVSVKNGNARWSKPFERTCFVQHHVPITSKDLQCFPEIPIKNSADPMRSLRKPELIFVTPSVQEAYEFLKKNYKVSISVFPVGAFNWSYSVMINNKPVLSEKLEDSNEGHAMHKALVKTIHHLKNIAVDQAA